MRLLLDTSILLWSAADLLPQAAQEYILDESNTLCFSPASIWEVVIKRGLGRADFDVDPDLLLSDLLKNGYEQIPITSQHTLLTATLPLYHKDPFDRIIIAQSIAERVYLITSDNAVAKYPASIIHIKR